MPHARFYRPDSGPVVFMRSGSLLRDDIRNVIIRRQRTPAAALAGCAADTAKALKGVRRPLSFCYAV